MYKYTTIKLTPMPTFKHTEYALIYERYAHIFYLYQEYTHLPGIHIHIIYI